MYHKRKRNPKPLEWNDARALLYVQNAFHIELQQTEAHGSLYPAWLRQQGKERKEKKIPLVASCCLVDSNMRSSRSTGAHWQTRSSEPSAQSQDPQSPQPIRGYTGGPELLVGGAQRGEETRPTTCSPCRWATQPAIMACAAENRMRRVC